MYNNCIKILNTHNQSLLLSLIPRQVGTCTANSETPPSRQRGNLSKSSSFVTAWWWATSNPRTCTPYTRPWPPLGSPVVQVQGHQKYNHRLICVLWTRFLWDLSGIFFVLKMLKCVCFGAFIHFSRREISFVFLHLCWYCYFHVYF